SSRIRTRAIARWATTASISWTLTAIVSKSRPTGPSVTSTSPRMPGWSTAVPLSVTRADVKPFKQGNFYLVRLREGFLALNRWCTHMNGIVVYQKAHWHFYCPYHYATYDRRGEPSPYPGNRAGGPLRLHPVTFSNEGHVLVDTSQVIERSAYEPGQAAVPPSGDPAQAVA